VACTGVGGAGGAAPSPDELRVLNRQDPLVRDPIAPKGV